MPMELAVEQVNSDKVPLSFNFDHAYWMSGLEPVDPAKGTARIDARTFAIPEPKRDLAPDVAAPISAGQSDPSAMEGQAWVVHPGTEPAARNAFEAELSGARAVRLDLQRMRISSRRTVSGDLETQAPLRLELLGDWAQRVTARIDGTPLAVERVSKTVVAVTIPAGKHALTLE
jgi:hypothetical protein